MVDVPHLILGRLLDGRMSRRRFFRGRRWLILWKSKGRG
jgi:hypothetical protein